MAYKRNCITGCCGDGDVGRDVWLCACGSLHRWEIITIIIIIDAVVILNYCYYQPGSAARECTKFATLPGRSVGARQSLHASADAKNFGFPLRKLQMNARIAKLKTSGLALVRVLPDTPCMRRCGCTLTPAKTNIYQPISCDAGAQWNFAPLCHLVVVCNLVWHSRRCMLRHVHLSLDNFVFNLIFVLFLCSCLGCLDTQTMISPEKPTLWNAQRALAAALLHICIYCGACMPWMLLLVDGILCVCNPNVVRNSMSAFPKPQNASKRQSFGMRIVVHQQWLCSLHL